MALTTSCTVDLIPGMDQDGQVESVEVDEVGTCIAAADFISGSCDMSRKQAQNTIINLLNSKNCDDAKKIFCRKATVPGFQQPTYVINYDECLDLVYLLPKQRVKHVLAFINHQFKRVRAGDQTLHQEVDARAADDGLEARMARESLKLQAIIQEDPEERALKRRKLAAEVESVELANKREAAEYIAVKARALVEAKSALETVFADASGVVGGREQIMVMDMLRAGAFGSGSQKMITDAPREEITVDEVIRLVGMRPAKGDRMKLGKLFATEFRSRYGEEPLQVDRWVDGAQRKVKCYEKKEQDWMLDVARAYYGLDSNSNDSD